HIFFLAEARRCRETLALLLPFGEAGRGYYFFLLLAAGFFSTGFAGCSAEFSPALSARILTRKVGSEESKEPIDFGCAGAASGTDFGSTFLAEIFGLVAFFATGVGFGSIFFTGCFFAAGALDAAFFTTGFSIFAGAGFSTFTASSIFGASAGFVFSTKIFAPLSPASSSYMSIYWLTEFSHEKSTFIIRRRNIP